MSSAAPLLRARGLVKAFRVRGSRLGRRQRLVAVDGVDLEVANGHCLALVGESGCGKTTLGRLLLRLLEPDAGEIEFDGADILALEPAALRRRRRDMQMVFQHSSTAFNPRQRIEQILGEPLRVHGLGGDARSRAESARRGLVRVGLGESVAERYAHELSGGQRQRLGIARALMTEPRLLVLDEPVAALDVSVKAQILQLLNDLQARLGLAMVFITHDLAVVRRVADRVMVLYLGRVVEAGPRREIFERPLHPYTAALLRAAPLLDPQRRQRVHPPRGEVPSPLSPPPGCRYHPRCPIARPRCRVEDPPLAQYGQRQAACHYPGEVGGPVNEDGHELLPRNDVG